MISYQRPAADGWRYHTSYRTRKVSSRWVVQKWSGAEAGWVYVADFDTYAEAREVA